MDDLCKRDYQEVRKESDLLEVLQQHSLYIRKMPPFVEGPIWIRHSRYHILIFIQSCKVHTIIPNL